MGEKRWYRNYYVVLTLGAATVLFDLMYSAAMLLLFVQNPNGQMFLYWLIPDALKTNMVTFPVVCILQGLIFVWTSAIEAAAYPWWCAMVFQNLAWIDQLLQ